MYYPAISPLVSYPAPRSSLWTPPTLLFMASPSEFSCLCLIAHLTEASCIVEKEQETVKQTNIGLVPIMWKFLVGHLGSNFTAAEQQSYKISISIPSLQMRKQAHREEMACPNILWSLCPFHCKISWLTLLRTKQITQVLSSSRNTVVVLILLMQ